MNQRTEHQSLFVGFAIATAIAIGYIIIAGINDGYEMRHNDDFYRDVRSSEY